jgi:hypothetical protein
MTNEDRMAIIESIILNERSIIKVKGDSYAGPNDVLKNFKDVAADTGLTKYQVWSVYFGKHLGSVHNAIKANPSGPVDGSEGMASRILDIRTYAGLLQCLLEEDGILT